MSLSRVPLAGGACRCVVTSRSQAPGAYNGGAAEGARRARWSRRADPSSVGCGGYGNRDCSGGDDARRRRRRPRPQCGRERSVQQQRQCAAHGHRRVGCAMDRGAAKPDHDRARCECRRGVRHRAFETSGRGWRHSRLAVCGSSIPPTRTETRARSTRCATRGPVHRHRSLDQHRHRRLHGDSVDRVVAVSAARSEKAESRPASVPGIVNRIDGSSRLFSDLFVSNSFGVAGVSDLRVFFSDPRSLITPTVASFGALQPSAVDPSRERRHERVQQ